MCSAERGRLQTPANGPADGFGENSSQVLRVPASPAFSIAQLLFVLTCCFVGAFYRMLLCHVPWHNHGVCCLAGRTVVATVCRDLGWLSATTRPTARGGVGVRLRSGVCDRNEARCRCIVLDSPLAMPLSGSPVCRLEGRGFAAWPIAVLAAPVDLALHAVAAHKHTGTAILLSHSSLCGREPKVGRRQREKPGHAAGLDMEGWQRRGLERRELLCAEGAKTKGAIGREGNSRPIVPPWSSHTESARAGRSTVCPTLSPGLITLLPPLSCPCPTLCSFQLGDLPCPVLRQAPKQPRHFLGWPLARHRPPFLSSYSGLAQCAAILQAVTFLAAL